MYTTSIGHISPAHTPSTPFTYPTLQYNTSTLAAGLLNKHRRRLGRALELLAHDAVAGPDGLHDRSHRLVVRRRFELEQPVQTLQRLQGRKNSTVVGK